MVNDSIYLKLVNGAAAAKALPRRRRRQSYNIRLRRRRQSYSSESKAAWFHVKIKLFYRISYPSRRPNYSRPRIAPAIAEDCYILVVFYLFFISHHNFFDIAGPIFAKCCHATRCVLKYFISYTGVHTCPLKIWGAKNSHFCRFADPKSTIWAPPFPIAGNIRKSKTIGSICGCVRTFIATTVGVPPPHIYPRNQLSPWCVGWGS